MSPTEINTHRPLIFLPQLLDHHTFIVSFTPSCGTLPLEPKPAALQPLVCRQSKASPSPSTPDAAPPCASWRSLHGLLSLFCAAIAFFAAETRAAALTCTRLSTICSGAKTQSSSSPDGTMPQCGGTHAVSAQDHPCLLHRIAQAVDPLTLPTFASTQDTRPSW